MCFDSWIKQEVLHLHTNYLSKMVIFGNINSYRSSRFPRSPSTKISVGVNENSMKRIKIYTTNVGPNCHE